MAVMWMAMNYFKQQKGAPPPPPAAQSANGAQVAANTAGKYSYPAFAKGSLVDMYCFISEKQSIHRYSDHLADLVWSERGLELGGKEIRNHTYIYEPSPAVQNNVSVYLHVVFAKHDAPLNPQEPGYDESLVFGHVRSLVTYHKRPKNDTTVSLLSGDALPLKNESAVDNRPIVSFFKPNMSVQIVDHFQAYAKTGIPPQIAPYMQFDEVGNHFPIIYFNEFWLLRDKLVLMNDTVSNVTLHLDFSTVSMWWWQMMEQMERSFQMQVDMGISQDGEKDELKRVLLEGNPVLLAITFVTSLLHTVFDMLAFKNDIGFWKNNKSMEGLSARSVIINACCQLVILFYLMDNETSYVVLFSSFVGTGIEFWKITKAMDVSVDMGRFPYVFLKDRASYEQNKTKQYDAEAMVYLSYVLYPLVACYAVYSLVYKTHKSWYSWVINSLVGAVYMFGFILMCPQLYLNYKLKSVAHLPWRQMTYKFLNTIIDDLFAFVIKMPLLHRLSVFRDDVIFCIFLYQRWIYRVDKTRVNEFGWAPEQPAEAVEAKPGEPAAQAEEKLLTDGADAGSGDEGKPRKRAGKGGKGKAVGEEKEAAAKGGAEGASGSEAKKGK